MFLGQSLDSVRGNIYIYEAMDISIKVWDMNEDIRHNLLSSLKNIQYSSFKT